MSDNFRCDGWWKDQHYTQKSLMVVTIGRVESRDNVYALCEDCVSDLEKTQLYKLGQKLGLIQIETGNIQTEMNLKSEA